MEDRTHDPGLNRSDPEECQQQVHDEELQDPGQNRDDPDECLQQDHEEEVQDVARAPAANQEGLEGGASSQGVLGGVQDAQACAGNRCCLSATWPETPKVKSEITWSRGARA